jgi:DNA polymerase-3 subunit gamma/tau
LLIWQAQLKGSEQQLRHSVNPRLWLEVLLLGLLAEPQLQAAPAAAPAQAVAAPPPTTRAQPAAAQSVVTQPVVAQAVATQAVQSADGQRGASAPAPAVRASPEATPEASPEATLETIAGAKGETNLGELWQQILAGLELPSTRMLLSQQAQLVRLDERRAVVTVAGNWMAMVQSRLPLLEKAMASALGSPRQLVLEGGGEMPAQPPKAPVPAPAPAPPSSAPVPAPAQAPAPTSVASRGPASALASSAPLDEKAKRLADFFNGEVIEMDDPINAA